MATASTTWATARAAADHLQVSERTLLRWRNAGLLKPGVHYRRKFVTAPNSPILYRLDECEQAMAAVFASDYLTLEQA
jgi:predicted site-specific integrase-resolvase